MLHGVPFIQTSRKYSGEEVRKFLAVYRNKYYQKNRELIVVKKSLKKHKAKKKTIINNYIERAKQNYKMYIEEKKKNEKIKKANKIKLEKERKKLNDFIVHQKKEIRKQEREKLKYKYVDPDSNTNPSNYEIITWIRISTKLYTVKRRTKLTIQEVLLLLWIYANGEGNSKASMLRRDIGIDISFARKNSKRLKEYNLIKVEDTKRAHCYDLTERGSKFIVPIVEFIKSKIVDAKRVKRKFVRDRVPAAETTPSIQDGGDSIQQEGAVL